MSRAVRLGIVAALWGLAALPARSSAQIKLRAIEDPVVGREAPDFTVGYVTAAGAGPAGQPFHLASELGRTVVLVFATSERPDEMRREWEKLAQQRDSLFPPGTAVVGVLRWKRGPTQELAAGSAAPFKLLPDSVSTAFRAYGVVGRQSRDYWAVFVVTPEGRLKYRSREFLPSDREQVTALRAGLH